MHYSDKSPPPTSLPARHTWVSTVAFWHVMPDYGSSNPADHKQIHPFDEFKW